MCWQGWQCWLTNWFADSSRNGARQNEIDMMLWYYTCCVGIFGWLEIGRWCRRISRLCLSAYQIVSVQHHFQKAPSLTYWLPSKKGMNAFSLSLSFRRSQHCPYVDSSHLSCGPQHLTTTLREPCASQNLSVDGVNYVMGVIYSDNSGNCWGSNPMKAQEYREE